MRCRMILAATAIAMLAGCSEPNEAELLNYAENAEGVVGQGRIDHVELFVLDGWDDGIEGLVRYRICGADRALDKSCETKEIPASFSKNDQGKWRPIPLNR